MPASPEITSSPQTVTFEVPAIVPVAVVADFIADGQGSPANSIVHTASGTYDGGTSVRSVRGSAVELGIPVGLPATLTSSLSTRTGNWIYAPLEDVVVSGAATVDRRLPGSDVTFIVRYADGTPLTKTE